ncbi:MAG: pilus assembly protein N-terminal domain-containing protein [Candidatus Acidiferrales bacterium]
MIFAILGASRPASAQQTEPSPQRLHVLVGRSLVITSPTRLRRVAIADPLTADAMLISSTQILIDGKAPGGVSLVLWNEADESQSFEIQVDLDILSLQQRVREMFPHESVELAASKDVVMVSGRVSSKEVADRIFQLISAAAPKAVNLMELPNKPRLGQILLQVKFAEVDRTAMNQFGFNLLSLPGSTTRTLASVGTEQFGSTTLSALQNGAGTPENQANLTLSDLLNVFIFRPDINLGATIKALQQKSLLQILAEPNLLTETGKEANFLAGGEFPYPVVQGGAAGSAPTVTIQFKEFGVRLNFTPELTESGSIHLRIRPEVSALDFTNAVTFSGFFIPAISTRRVDVQLELSDGQSFVIAGLVDNRVTQILNKVPGLGDMPVLGPLFRSHSFQKSNSELLILVTPRIVMPIPVSATKPDLIFPEPFMPPTQPKPEEKAPAKP